MADACTSARIGLFGGSFDPIHYGHLAVAAYARAALALDRLIFIPSGTPASSAKQPHCANGSQRLEMIRLATEGLEGVGVSDCEVVRGGPSFTVDTISELRDRLPSDAEIFFVVGADHVPNLPCWRGIAQMREWVRFVAMDRPGVEPVLPGWVHRIAMPPVDISSRRLRRLLAAKAGVDGELPPPVLDYIAREALYGHS